MTTNLSLMLVVGAMAAQQAACTPPALAPLFPAAGLAVETRNRGGTVIEINPTETELTPRMTFSLRETASSGLAALLDSGS